MKHKPATLSAAPPPSLPPGSAICQRVMMSPWFAAARSVGLYVTCERLREVDTSVLLAAALQDGEQQQQKQQHAAHMHVHTCCVRF